MKTIILILLLTVSSIAFASDTNPSQHTNPNDYWRNKEIQQRENMMRGLEREYYETGRISPKTPTDVYNLRHGYGYDGGISVPNGNYPAYQGYGY